MFDHQRLAVRLQHRTAAAHYRHINALMRAAARFQFQRIDGGFQRFVPGFGEFFIFLAQLISPPRGKFHAPRRHADDTRVGQRRQKRSALLRGPPNPLHAAHPMKRRLNCPNEKSAVGGGNLQALLCIVYLGLAEFENSVKIFFERLSENILYGVFPHFSTHLARRRN